MANVISNQIINLFRATNLNNGYSLRRLRLWNMEFQIILLNYTLFDRGYTIKRCRYISINVITIDVKKTLSNSH